MSRPRLAGRGRREKPVETLTITRAVQIGATVRLHDNTQPQGCRFPGGCS